jgi:glucose/mannose-6-phosphate isomerase
VAIDGPVGDAILDDERALRAADPQGVLDSYLRTGGQLVAAYRTASERLEPVSGAASVTFCAMGGSAAAGDVVAATYRDRLPIPMATVRGYRLPAHCGPDDLVVCVSYSGNTEETLTTYAEATSRGCRVMAVCSGGELADRAGAHGVPVALVPPDVPQPRAALGSLVGAVLGGLRGLVPADEELESAGASLSSVAERLDPSVDSFRNPAKSLVTWLSDRIPIVWGSEGVTEAAAFRWKSAFNENAKIPSFAAALPELDHHEVAGWSEGWGGGFRLVVLRHQGDHESVGPRLEATLEAIDGSGLETREVHAPAGPPLAAALCLMMVGDCASAYHALARGIDPAPIEAIAKVKARLAEGR